jgi:hypothetical protein
MARINKGILGPITGTLANITGYERLGTPCIRINGERQKQNFTDKQLAHQLRVRLANSFINPSKSFINVGFSLSTSRGQTAHNVAMSQALKTGIKGQYPELELDFEHMLVADGVRQGARNAEVTSLEGNHLLFTWAYDEMEEFSIRRDQVMLLAYSPATQISFYTIGGAPRYSKQAILEVYPEIEQESLETYIAFITEDRKAVSKSTYTGNRILL